MATKHLDQSPVGVNTVTVQNSRAGRSSAKPTSFVRKAVSNGFQGARSIWDSDPRPSIIPGAPAPFRASCNRPFNSPLRVPFYAEAEYPVVGRYCELFYLAARQISLAVDQSPQADLVSCSPTDRDHPRARSHLPLAFECPVVYTVALPSMSPS